MLTESRSKIALLNGRIAHFAVTINRFDVLLNEVWANKCNGGVLTMVNKHCAYGECRSDSRYIHKSFMQGVFFIKFPIVKKLHLNRSAEKLSRWVRACSRQDLTIV